MNYLQFQFTCTPEEGEMLVAMLSEAGFEGFEESSDGLSAFIAENNFDAAAFEEVIKSLPAVHYIKEEVAQINWNAQWESGFEPVVVNDFVAVRAAFHQPITGVQHEVIITPKMSFGTGHHATTWQVIAQMEHIGFRDKKVLDFGTGTAVLAIVAEKLGAAAVDAIDNDEWSINNGRENIAANDCRNINIYQAETVPADRVYDIILANINLNVILAHLPKLAAASHTGTIVVLSGFLAADRDTMTAALETHGFENINIAEKQGWLCIACKRGS